jgi:hypothetical protein
MNDPRIRKWLEQVRQGRWDTTRHNNLHVPKREVLKRGFWRPVLVGGVLMMGSPVVSEAWYEVDGRDWPHPHRYDNAILLKNFFDEKREDTNYFDFVALATIKFLTGAGLMPSDMSSGRVDLIGAGWSGASTSADNATAPQAGGAGGAAGSWAYKLNATGLSSSTPYSIPAVNSGADCTFNTNVVVAKSATGTGASQGLASGCTGDQAANGGAGGAGGGTNGSRGAGGGGGAGAGGKGASDLGAAGEAGSVGADSPGNSDPPGSGGNGGRGNGTTDAAGTGGSGGSDNATAGSDGSEYTETVGGAVRGSGGGGGGGCGGSGANQMGRPGKSGGRYGAGGGGGGAPFFGNFGAGGAGGAGVQGVGVLNYVAAGGSLLALPQIVSFMHMLAR